MDIELLESSLHRENAGYVGTPGEELNPQNAELWSEVLKQGSNNTSPYKAGDTFYTDDQIEANAATYTCDGVELAPGQSYHKMPYVKNVGNNDAYIRIRVMIPSDANRDYWQARSGGVIESQFCTTAITSGEFMHGKRTDYPIIDASGKGYVDGNGVKYDVYTFIRTEPLKPGEMTEWNVWNYIGIADEATSANIQKAVDKGAILVSEDGTMTVNVLVQADAIQAEGFANAKAAFAAFDAQA